MLLSLAESLCFETIESCLSLERVLNLFIQGNKIYGRVKCLMIPSFGILLLQGTSAHPMKQSIRKIYRGLKDDKMFLKFLGNIETFVSKVLSLAMVLVILATVWDLFVFLTQTIQQELLDPGHLTEQLISIFGLFLNILIALEVLENITAYLRNHVVQMELVIATSLIAVARKIIILDLTKVDGIQLIGLAIAIAALSFSYWLVKRIAKGERG